MPTGPKGVLGSPLGDLVLGGGEGITTNPVPVSASTTVNIASAASESRKAAAGVSESIALVAVARHVFHVTASNTINVIPNVHTRRIGVSASSTIATSIETHNRKQQNVEDDEHVGVSDVARAHNTVIRVSVTDTIGATLGSHESGEWDREGIDTITIADVASGRTQFIPVFASTGLNVVPFANNGKVLQVGVVDEIFVTSTTTRGHSTRVSATDTIGFSDRSGTPPGVDDSLAITDLANARPAITRVSNSAAITDIAEARIRLPNPELGMSVVLWTGYDEEFPANFMTTPDGLVLISNGVDPVLRWDAQFKVIDTAGIIPPATAPTLTATIYVPATGQAMTTYSAYVRFEDRYGNFSDLSPLSVVASGKAPFTYTNVPISSERKVVRRQILRAATGEASVYYVDIDTDDIISTTFTSTKNDEDLLAGLPVALFDTDGSPLANTNAIPPSWKSIYTAHLGRVFAAVDVEYRIGSIAVAQGTTTVVGTGTHWKASMVGRILYVTGSKGAYPIASVDEDAQTLEIESNFLGASDLFAEYAIRASVDEAKLVYFSEALLPESWPIINAFGIQEDGDELTGLVAFGSFLYIMEKRHIYKFTFLRDPGASGDGSVFLSSNRGCLNNRCHVSVEDAIYMLDEQGIHKFSGGTSEPISSSIQTLFQPGTAGTSVNWSADQRLWHAAWEPLRETIRWFVAFGADPFPRDAICFNYRLSRFWLEHYEVAVTSSCEGTVGARRSLAGSEARRVMMLSEGTLDGLATVPGTSGKILASTALTVTTETISLAASALGLTFGITSGRGSGQVRTIADVVGRIVTLDRPWTIAPDQDSTYQIGGFSWVWKSGWMRFVGDDSEESNPRDVEVVFEPTKGAASFDMRLYFDHATNPQVWAFDSRDSGVKVTKGESRVKIDCTKAIGYAMLRRTGHKETYADGRRFESIELTGVSSSEPIRVYSMLAAGVEN